MTKTVLFTGAECSGKSSLANGFGFLVVDEYVREFIDTHRRDTTYDDVDPIAKEQLHRENVARSSGEPLVIFDTNLISNLLYSKMIFGRASSWIEPTLINLQYDLILLLDPNGVVWQADGQRCLDTHEKRAEFFEAIKSWLNLHNKPYIIVGGSYQERHNRPKELINKLL